METVWGSSLTIEVNPCVEILCSAVLVLTREQRPSEIYHCKIVIVIIQQYNPSVIHTRLKSNNGACEMRPKENVGLFFFKGRKKTGGKWSQHQKEKKKKPILQPSSPSFLWGWGLPVLIQQQLYNVFVPFNRLHQHAIPFADKQLKLPTKGCLKRPWGALGSTEQRDGGELMGRITGDNTSHYTRRLKEAFLWKSPYMKCWIH